MAWLPLLLSVMVGSPPSVVVEEEDESVGIVVDVSLVEAGSWAVTPAFCGEDCQLLHFFC